MGVKSKKKAKTRLDAYYRLAKDQGYRSRAAFKLIQLNKKYDFLGKSKVCVDLCAAPGGWCQVAAKHMPMGSKIVGVDLVPIVPIRGVKTFVGDITADKTRKVILNYLKKEAKEPRADCVIHDGAPNVGGAWSKDLFAQNALVLCALKMATDLLRPGGWFVSKVFRSPDFQKIIWVLKQFFERVEATKPLASRMESAEIFVVCNGYKAPKSIDPKMFSAGHVFSDVGEEKILRPNGVMVTPHTNVPMGYDTEHTTIIHRTATLTQFLHAKNAKEFLGHFHEITFPEEDRHHLKSRWSKKELVYLCHDLQQVGEADKRRLIRWREQLIREQRKLQRLEEGLPEDEVEEEGEEAEEGDEMPQDEEAIAAELLAIRKKREKELKGKQRKLVQRKLKQVQGLINYDPTEGARHPIEDEDELSEIEEDGANFRLAHIAKIDEMDITALFDKNFEEADAVMNHGMNAVTNVDLQAEEEIDFGGKGDGMDAAPEHVIEGEEEAYDIDEEGNYVLAQSNKHVSQFKATNVTYARPDSEAGSDEEETPEDLKKREREEADDVELEAAGRQAKWQRRQTNIEKILNRTFPKPRDPKKKSKRLEENLVEMRGGDMYSDEGEEPEDDVSSVDSGYIDSDREEDTRNLRQGHVNVPDIGKLTAMELTKQQRKATKKDNKEKGKKKKGKKDDGLFEEIPMAMTDPDIRARTLAIATKMLDPRARRDMLEAGINRFSHNDDEELPEWFRQEEQMHCRVELPVTAAEIEAQRRRFIEMNSRPGKKVAEAMGRKRRQAQRMLRAMVEKGKTDPRAREKAKGVTVRTLMRSKQVKGENKKKKGPMDPKLKGQKKRERQAMKKSGKGKGRR